MVTRVCIIRHAETDWNKAQRIQGQIDIPLNETGHVQALAMAYNAAHHAFATIYSSDLQRASQTAAALAQREQHEVRIRPDLRERHYGIFQGVVKDEAGEQLPAANARYLARDLHYDFEHGESLLAFAQRVLAAFDWLRKHHQNEQIAVVSHAGVLDVMYRQATGRRLEAPRDFMVPNCALNWFRYEGGRWHVDHWDDHHHLKQVLKESAE